MSDSNKNNGASLSKENSEHFNIDFLKPLQDILKEIKLYTTKSDEKKPLKKNFDEMIEKVLDSIENINLEENHSNDNTQTSPNISSRLIEMVRKKTENLVNHKKVKNTLNIENKGPINAINAIINELEKFVEENKKPLSKYNPQLGFLSLLWGGKSSLKTYIIKLEEILNELKQVLNELSCTDQNTVESSGSSLLTASASKS